jgi:hypothetical protein
MTITVEATRYGWSVRLGEDQLGHFTTKQHAVEAAEKCQAKLKGEAVTLTVIGDDPEPAKYTSRPSWHCR